MKKFYTFISRALLVIFTANCLLPSVSWAQRGPMRRGGQQSQAQAYAAAQNLLNNLRRSERVSLDDLNLEPSSVQRDSVLGMGQAQYEKQFREQVMPKIEEQVARSEEVRRQTLPQVKAALVQYNQAEGVEDVANALNRLYRSSLLLANEQPETLNSAFYLRPDMGDVAQLYIPFGKDGDEVLDNMDQFVRGLYLKEQSAAGFYQMMEDFSRLLEVADPILYPDTHTQSRAYVAQIMAQTAEQWAAEKPNKIALDLLLRAQLRLARRIGHPYVSKTQAVADPEEKQFLSPLSSLEVEQNARVKEIVKNMSPQLSSAPKDATDSTLRGWYRMALLNIHQLYEKWGVPDPLGLDMNVLAQDFLREIATLRAGKLKGNEKNFSAFVVLGTFAVMFFIKNDGDVSEVIRLFDDDPQSHLTKKTKLTTLYASAVQMMMPIIAEEVRFSKDEAQARKLKKTLLSFTDKEKYSVAVRLAALETLGNLRMEQLAEEWKCKSAYGRRDEQDDSCRKFIFTDELRNALAKKVLELYWPLNSTHFASMRNYGLDSSQMQALANELVLLYNKFALEPIPQVLNYQRDANRNVYNENSMLVLEGKDGFLHNVIEREEGILYDAQGNQYNKMEGNWYRIYAPYAQPINQKKRSDEVNLALAKIVGETIVWAAVFKYVAIAFRTLRGVYVALPEAAKAVKAGQGMAGVSSKIKQGVQLSNIMQAASEAGITVQVLEKGATKAKTLKSYSDLTGLVSKDIVRLNVFYGSEAMASLEADALRQLPLISKFDTWKFISSNLVPQGPNAAVGLKALQGSPFSWFNPYLRQIRRDMDLLKAVNSMASSGEFDLWIGRAPAGVEGPVAAKDKIWVNLRHTDLQREALNEAFASGNVQLAVTPNSSLGYDFFGRKVVPSSPFEGMTSPFLPQTEAQYQDLMEHFWTNPRIFGITDPAALGTKDPNMLWVLEEAMDKYAQQAAKGFADSQILIGPKGVWQLGAAEMWGQAGEAEMLYGHILKSNMGFLRFEGNLAVWTGFRLADDLTYTFGFQDWMNKKTMQAVEKQSPEFSQTQKEMQAQAAKNAPEGVSQAQQEESVMQKVNDSAKPQTNGMFFSAPIAWVRSNVSEEIVKLPDNMKDLLQMGENKTRLNNAVSFAEVYMSFQEVLNTMSLTSDTELRKIAQTYNTRLEQLKQEEGPTYIDKIKQAVALQIDWAYENVNYSIESLSNTCLFAGVLSLDRVLAYAKQAQEIKDGAMPKEQKNEALAKILDAINAEGVHNYWVTNVINSKVNELAQEYEVEQDSFADLLSEYEQRINTLLEKPTTSQQDLSDEEQAFNKAFDARTKELKKSGRLPKKTKQSEIEGSIDAAQEDLYYGL